LFAIRKNKFIFALESYIIKINLSSFMTLQEAEKRLNLVRLQLEIMRLYKDDLLKQFGKRGYDDRLNEVLDKFIYFSKLCKKLKKLEE
jgi:hypothetical protein